MKTRVGIKPRIHKNRYDNWNGYLGGKWAVEFGCGHDGEEKAQSWFDQRMIEYEFVLTEKRFGMLK